MKSTVRLFHTVLAALIACSAMQGLAEGAASESSRAEISMQEHAASIYQVRILNRGSRSQSALGTGFFIDDGNVFATNYHVISSVVLEPEKYYAVIDIEGEEQEISVEAIDVIHDLAILRSSSTGIPLLLSSDHPVKGARLYSIGNPHDIGMTIVEGNYNGLVDNRFFDQIHFSGAINSGMSGGPTLNAKGEVVGINVASAGNQVGFLVPVDKLSILLDEVKTSEAEQENFNSEELISVPETPKAPDPVSVEAGSLDYSPLQPNAKETLEKQPTRLQKSIGVQVQRATHSMISKMLENPWPTESLGESIVVGKVHEAVDCWGDSKKTKKQRIQVIKKGCNSRDGFFISSNLRSGYIEYEFAFHEVDEWPTASLYKHATLAFSGAMPGNRAGSKDVDNYSCVDRIVARERDGFKRKISYCTRPYLKYEDIFDVFYMGVSLDKTDKVLMEHFTLSGVAKSDANRFLEYFVNQVGWE